MGLQVEDELFFWPALRVSGGLEGLPLLPALLHPDRWLLWLGVLFIVCVYYFPSGIVGRLRARRAS